jgi:hypothetical protein
VPFAVPVLFSRMHLKIAPLSEKAEKIVYLTALHEPYERYKSSHSRRT